MLVEDGKVTKLSVEPDNTGTDGKHPHTQSFCELRHVKYFEDWRLMKGSFDGGEIPRVD
jgi:hypothetical protein